jgi:hypothetical protein
MIRFRMAMVAIVLPVALAAIAIAIQLAWLPELPDQIVTHWSFGDRPDSYGPGWTSPVLTALVAVLPAAIGGILLVRLMPAGGPSRLQKLLASTVLLMAVLISVIATGTLAIQLPGASGADAGALPVVLAGVVTALVVAVAGWFIMPPSKAVAAQATPAKPVAVAPGERVAWVGVARFALPILLPLIGVVIAALGLTAYLFVTTGIWGTILIPIVVGVSVLGSAFWHVRADERGLTVRGALGWPLFRVPASEIQSAGALRIDAMGEFAGWGIRFGRGRRVGIVTRSGEALEVQRRDGRALVVTVDDAATAAGVLEAYASKVDEKG